jgi:hypothetical protein
MALQRNICFRLNGMTFLSCYSTFSEPLLRSENKLTVIAATGFIKADSQLDPSTSDQHSLFHSLFIYYLFNDAVNFSDKITSNGTIVME